METGAPRKGEGELISPISVLCTTKRGGGVKTKTRRPGAGLFSVFYFCVRASKMGRPWWPNVPDPGLAGTRLPSWTGLDN